MAIAWFNSIMLVVGLITLAIGRFGVPFVYWIRGRRTRIIGVLLVLPSIVSVVTSLLGMEFWSQLRLLELLTVLVLAGALVLAETDPAPSAKKQRARRRRCGRCYWSGH